MNKNGQNETPKIQRESSDQNSQKTEKIHAGERFIKWYIPTFPIIDYGISEE